MQTPYFVIDEGELRENIRAFRDALDKFWPNSHIAYSIKTNSLPWVLKFMKEQGVLAEAVSEEEAELALLCGYAPEQIVYNGPIKSEESFLSAVRRGMRVNMDAERELRALGRENIAACGNIGIRVNADLAAACPEDFEYAQDGFRFGFSYEKGEVKRVLQLLREKAPDAPVGLHLHCNSITRSLNVYKHIGALAAEIIRKYDLKVSYIDVGGGFFGGVPGKPGPEQYMQIIARELEQVVDKAAVKLIIEPGSALIGSPVSLVSSVLDTKDTSLARIVTTDASRLLVDPTWRKSRYFYTLKTKGEPFARRQVVCGYTCMDHDRLMVLENSPELKEGDRIIYHKVGAYTVTLGGAFIRFLPEVYVYADGEYHKVRSRTSVESYYQLQT